MNHRALFIAGIAVTLLVPAASAQFIGDALAAGGVAISEAQAMDIVAAGRGITPPPAGGTVQSTDPQSVKTYAPESLGTDVGIIPRQRPAAGSAPQATSTMPQKDTGSPASSSAVSQPPMGGSSGYAGARLQAETIDPVELSAWQAGMNAVGTTVKSLPASVQAVTFEGRALSYDKGVFYEKKGAGYVAVAAPVGATIPAKPVGSSTVFAGGKPYIYYFGTFYVYDGGQRAYVVVAPPAGAFVDYLPDSAKKVEWNGTTHYSYAGSYYKPYYRGSKLVFEVAASS